MVKIKGLRLRAKSGRSEKMKVRYIGPRIGVDGLTPNKIYEVIKIEPPFFRVIDDSEEDYLYYMLRPQSLDQEGVYGKFEIVEDPDGTLAEAMRTQRKADEAYDKAHQGNY